MALNQKTAENALEIDRLATQLAKDPHSKVFMPLAEEYGKAGMWQEAAAVLEDGLKFYPGFITAMVALGRAYDHMGQPTKAKAVLEESVKLSPENLRAHRTLIKIYQNQGLHESALQSCSIILAINPRDEEALSAQSALRRSPKQKPEQEPPQPEDSVAVMGHLSAQTAPAPLVPVEATISAQETSAGPVISVPTQVEPETAAADPLLVATELMEAALHRHDQTGEQQAVREPAPHAAEAEVKPPPSPHAGVVAQLEAWLRTIESRRRDRQATNESLAKTS